MYVIQIVDDDTAKLRDYNISLLLGSIKVEDSSNLEFISKSKKTAVRGVFSAIKYKNKSSAESCVKSIEEIVKSNITSHSWRSRWRNRYFIDVNNKPKKFIIRNIDSTDWEKTINNIVNQLEHEKLKSIAAFDKKINKVLSQKGIV